MSSYPHPTAIAFLRYCDEQIAKALLPAAMTENSSMHAMRVQAEISRQHFLRSTWGR